MRSAGVDDDSTVVVHKATELALQVSSGELSLTEAKEAASARVKEKLELLLAAGQHTKDVSDAIRKARINLMMLDDDNETAVEGVKLSQKENGIGAPATAIQVNMTDGPPPGLVDLMKVEEADE